MRWNSPSPGFSTTIATRTDSGDWAFLGAGVVLFLVSAGATVYWSGAMSGGMLMPGGWDLSMVWMQMPGQTWLGSAGAFMAMWMAMMIAMMLPALWPVLERYRQAIRGSGNARAGALTAGAGYFVVWAAVGAAAYAIGVGLAATEMQSPGLARSVPIAAGVVLLLTGAFQLTPWKARQLGHCRAGLACGSSPSGDLRSAGRLGLRYGVHCGLCCAGFMLVLLVTGMMSLLTIVVVAAAITIERLTSRSEWAVRAAGFIALGIGALILLRGVR